jgi:ubiquinone/menaquinone biosynthesis C-methylase UbiE
MDWQATARGESVDALGTYLDAMAALPTLRRVAEQTLALLPLAPGQSIIEVGCGTGVFLPLLAAAVGPDGHIEAIDHSPQFVAAAAQERIAAAGLAEAVTVREADACHLPYAENTFDAAHCERVLMHLDNPTVARREMCRVVGPGGIVVAEPHWYDLQIDHPDHEAMELLIHRHAMDSYRQLRMGLELNRHMYEAGLSRVDLIVPTHGG